MAVLRLITSSNLVGLLDRQVGGLGAIENLGNERCRTSRQIGDIRSIGKETPAFNKLSRLVHRWKPMYHGKFANLPALGEELCIG